MTDDQQIVKAVRHGIQLLKGGMLRYSQRIEVDGFAVVVRVVPADDRREEQFGIRKDDGT